MADGDDPPVVIGGLVLDVGNLVGKAEALRADATIDSHWSNRIVPGGQCRMSFDAKAADVLWIG